MKWGRLRAMRVGWVGLLLAAGTASGAPLRIAAPGFSVVEVAPAKASFLLEYVAQAMASDEVRVITQKEIATIVGVERQKELLDCSETSSNCMAELGAALGSDALLLGEIGRFGKRFQFSLKVISAKDGAPLASTSGKAESEEELVDRLAEAGKELGDALRLRIAAKDKPAGVSVQPRAARPLWLVPVAAGVAAGGAGIALMVLSGATARPLSEAATLEIANAAALRDSANTQLTAGTALAVTGGAALLAGLGWWVFGGRSSATAFVLPDGGGISIAGALP